MLRSSQFLWLFAASLFLLSPTASSAETAPKELAGKFGFDWLKPEKARCQELTEKNLTGMKSCRHHRAGDAGSFTGKTDFFVCKSGEKSEWMVYKTQARCVEELETMQANGP